MGEMSLLLNSSKVIVPDEFVTSAIVQDVAVIDKIANDISIHVVCTSRHNSTILSAERRFA